MIGIEICFFLSLVLGAWCLVLGAWCLVLGAWCLIFLFRTQNSELRTQNSELRTQNSESLHPIYQGIDIHSSSYAGKNDYITWGYFVIVQLPIFYQIKERGYGGY